MRRIEKTLGCHYKPINSMLSMGGQNSRWSRTFKIIIRTGLVLTGTFFQEANLAHSQQSAVELAEEAARNTTVIDAECTRSVITLVTQIPLRCIEKPMHILWPNGRASIIFIATDQDGKELNVSFNANRDEQPTLRRYVMKLSDVRFGELETPEKWTKFPVKGTCEIVLQDDAGTKVEGITCLAKAPRGLAIFDFSTGPGTATNSRLAGVKP